MLNQEKHVSKQLLPPDEAKRSEQNVARASLGTTGRGKRSLASFAGYPFSPAEPAAAPPNDAATRLRVQEALRAHPDLDAGDIDVYVANGEVTLLGVVSGLRAEQIALDVAWECEGVRCALSQLRLDGAAMRDSNEGIFRPAFGEG
jgi:hypothetical protein